jgi:hypothetical protein
MTDTSTITIPTLLRKIRGRIRKCSENHFYAEECCCQATFAARFAAEYANVVKVIPTQMSAAAKRLLPPDSRQNTQM